MLGNDQLHDLSEKIADELEGWRYDKLSDSEDIAFLVNGRGRKLKIRRDWRKSGMLDVIGVLSREKKNMNDIGYDTVGNSIGCSYTRTPRSIAGDIKRRLLPEFEAECLRVEVEREKRNMDAAKLQYRDSLLQKTFSCLRKQTSYSSIARSSGPSYSIPRVSAKDMRILVHLSSWDDVMNFELSGIPEDLAYQLLDTIIKYGQGEGQ